MSPPRYAGCDVPLRSCAVTGANGFVGSNVVRELLRRGVEVTALVGGDQDCANLAGLPVKVQPIELLEPRSLRPALIGSEVLVHSAACYALWCRNPADIYRVNVDGTRNVLVAAREAGVRRVAYTSTAATLCPGLGVGPVELADEDAVLDQRRFLGHYKTSKAMAEREALRMAARGLPVVILHPTSVLGPGDRRPTPTGEMIEHFLRGWMRVYVDMVLNLIDVEDVARGHVLALERAPAGGRYLLGGENLPMDEILAILSDLTGIPAPRHAVPKRVLSVVGRASDWIADRITHRPPLVPYEAALHARDAGGVSAARARAEFGFSARPARQVLARAVSWFVAEGRCSPRVAEAVLGRGSLDEAVGER